MNDINASQKEKVLLEQTLWNEVKKIRALKDSSFPIFLYLIGYYNKILFHVAARASSPDDLFQYHVLIRLGDLNRYMERIDVAEYYYCNARNLFPFFGHAYNQLGLLTKSNTCYKCCYYYARAAKSSERNLRSIADSNLRMAVNKDNCYVINHILNENTPIDIDRIDDEEFKLPTAAIEWFYLMVVAIYADNIQSIARLFLNYINTNLSTQRTTIFEDTNNIKSNFLHNNNKRDDYMLLTSLDILLDWLKLGSQGKTLCPQISVDLRSCRGHLNAMIRINNNNASRSMNTTTSSNTTMIEICSPLNSSSNKTSSLNTSNSTTQDSFATGFSDDNYNLKGLSSQREEALPHDYILRGFSPLDSVHRRLIFHNDWNQTKVDKVDPTALDHTLLHILVRTRNKIDSFGSLIKKRTRNIALESILSNMNPRQSD